MYGEITDQQGVSVFIIPEPNQKQNLLYLSSASNVFRQAKHKTTTIAADEIIFLDKQNKN